VAAKSDSPEGEAAPVYTPIGVLAGVVPQAGAMVDVPPAEKNVLVPVERNPMTKRRAPPAA
jgi:hypothetical protein